uniref:Uncharacterized protein n=1 Tax=Arundo donax TaxID=35708 RepID=A0A0A8Y437_ARUDO
MNHQLNNIISNLISLSKK